MRLIPRLLLPLIVMLPLIGPPPAARATDIEGVQPAALDQPRVNAVLRRQPGGEPLAAEAGGAGGGGIEAMLGLDDPIFAGGEVGPVFNIQAFLDTGASGVLISRNTAEALAIDIQTVPRPQGGQPKPVVFFDVGVGGRERFHVSEPLHVALAAYDPRTNTSDPNAHYVPAHREPLRAQVGPIGKGAIGALGDLLGGDGAAAAAMEMVLGNLDVFGMPVMQGKVVVMDPKPVNTFADTMRTYVYDPDARRQDQIGPGIPETNRHVRLSYVTFAPFTELEPPDAPGPTLAANPMIGPDPVTGQNADVPGITLRHNGQASTASWLLDTGAAASIISTRQAAALGVTYREGTEGTDSPVLDGVPRDRQFTLTIGGIGGMKRSAGFFADELVLPTVEGEPIVYRGAPVLVLDIEITDPRTNERFVLDGVFGMNFLVATAFVTEGLMPDISDLTEGAYDWVVFDEPRGMLGLQLRQDLGE